MSHNMLVMPVVSFRASTDSRQKIADNAPPKSLMIDLDQNNFEIIKKAHAGLLELTSAKGSPHVMSHSFLISGGGVTNVDLFTHDHAHVYQMGDELGHYLPYTLGVELCNETYMPSLLRTATLLRTFSGEVLIKFDVECGLLNDKGLAIGMDSTGKLSTITVSTGEMVFDQLLMLFENGDNPVDTAGETS